ncbi:MULTISPECIES: acetyl-CoA carboxylase biotin carboxyl carrier protein [Bacillaceae]|mgnify:CR=1 FL=1|uniref:acetyl-CoA carboxylase biotin carboxyl carrier protein n=1 Tax=Bacillaceae TaxID=186817 RepID=UPI001C57A1FB|nr:acetyl-CoA carboxylase biotin carboxyl carrier protein [Rossellomorea sp. YZS02]MBW3113569.1 acetyl-CoA carboxylase biotin carboxyl carrier protein [Bacillus sp. MCCB 382]MDX8344825.1 acetyl-CoA carboxylase biotin carboxyl carrier protein [Rossellomorea sp. YZS02]
MLKIQEIREIIKLVDQSSVEEFTYEHDGSKINLKKNNGVTVSAQPQVVQAVEEVKPAAQAVQQAPVQEAPAPAQPVKEAPQANVEDENLHKITSPMVGTFYQSSSPEAGPYVKVGDKVDESSVVCIVEAMKLFNEIEAEAKGEIVEILVKDGQLVEYGQPLFLVKPE